MFGSDYPHRKRVLLALDCGAGGRQFRRYCTSCWQAGGAIPHSAALRELRGAKPVIGDLALLDAARDAYWRSQRDSEQGLLC